MCEDVPWLSPAELRSWTALGAMLVLLPTAIDAQLRRDAGLNFFDYSVMATLSDAPERAIRMSTLARFAAGSLSRLSHAVARLEGQGWVERRPSAVHPHSVEAVLTDAGLAKMQQAAPGHVREVRRLVVDNVTAAQLAQLGRTARAIVEATAPASAGLLE